MATKAFTGKGATLLVSNVAVAQVKTMQWTSPKWTTEDITNLSSPTLGAGIVQEVIPTVMNPGEFNAQVVYLANDNGLANLYSAFSNASVQTFTVQLAPQTSASQANVGDAFSFSGYVTDQPVPDGIAPDKAIMYKVGVKITGPLTRTQGN